MKKNLMSVLILALVLANLILTAVLTISVLPQAKQANELISKVCAAIDLDLEGGSVEEASAVPLEDVATYSLNSGETMTINLKPGEDGVEHFALVKVVMGMNSKDKDYKKYGTAENLADKEGMMQGRVFAVISSHTVDEMRNDVEAIQDELLKEFRKMYDSNFIVEVSFTVTYQ
ncbi:MAG: flagellar basal body-associated protein FliL [Lachnospiraceae bacterium]|jgi:flagellar basal body-associated protein FliL|nr:flagellar basal body-associated protein FliL [Lachnospiraceae bacterium]